jgi:medium-chain acyl-[acyl-carrier-protein] hydrolase
VNTRLRHSSVWLARPELRPEPRDLLFCFPYAGGGTEIFRGWGTRLKPSIEPVLIQLPGRGARLREPCIKDMEALAKELAGALYPALDRPFAFFGHSMGALIAFAVTRRLERRGILPKRLFLSCCPAPQLMRERPNAASMSDSELITYLHALGGTPLEVFDHPELLDIVLPTVRADLEMIDSYELEPGPSLRCPLSLCYGLDDASTPPEIIEPWSVHTAGGSTLRGFAGTHYFINTPPPSLFDWIVTDLEASEPQQR